LEEANLTVKNPSTGDETIVTLIVVPNEHTNLLGFKAVQNMGLITVANKFIADCVDINGTIEMETDFTIVDIHKCCYILIGIIFNDGYRLF
jgi:hypothetical protein